MMGAPGKPGFAALPTREEARALLARGDSDNVAVSAQPTTLPFPIDQAQARVLGAVGTLSGWSLVAAGTDVVWATRTTPMLGFVDDVLILLTPDETGTRVEARSASRVGSGDLGRNRTTLRELHRALSRWT